MVTSERHKVKGQVYCCLLIMCLAPPIWRPDQFGKSQSGCMLQLLYHLYFTTCYIQNHSVWQHQRLIFQAARALLCNITISSNSDVIILLLM